MAKPNTRRLDRDIRHANRKLKAVQDGEMWPLTGRERRAVVAAMAGGSYKVVRGKSPARAERKLEMAWDDVKTRLSAELSALESERQKVANEAAAEAAKKSSGWW